MKTTLKLRTYRIGTPRKRGEGMRIATVRHPPRGVPKSQWHKLFDVWFPVVAPSRELLSRAPRDRMHEPAVSRKFFAAYEREMKKGDAHHAIVLLAALALHTPISIGCFCE